MRTWLFIGSSPDAPRQLEAAKDLIPAAKVISANGGILLDPSPYVYLWSYEGSMSNRWMEPARIAQKSGTKIIGWDFQLSDWPWIDETISRSDKEQLSAHDYSPLHYSGQVCMHYACGQGAERLLLAGCEGYSKTEEIYFDAEHRIEEDVLRFRQAKGDTVNDQIIVPETTMVCNCWPDVEFVCVGRPRYTIGAKNWKVIDA